MTSNTNQGTSINNSFGRMVKRKTRDSGNDEIDDDRNYVCRVYLCTYVRTVGAASCLWKKITLQANHLITY